VSWEKEGTCPDRLLYDKSLLPSTSVLLIMTACLGSRSSAHRYVKLDGNVSADQLFIR
jgi:hypothetical protein